MKKETRFWLLLAGLALIPGLLCLPWEPIRFGALFLGALAVGCAGQGLCVQLSGRVPLARALARLGRVLFTLFVLSFVWIQGMILAGAQADPQAAQADYVLVLGAHIYPDRPSASLAKRLDTAAGFLRAHPHTIAILCGGQGDNEPMPEAEMMASYLQTQHGIPAARLRTETQSRNTIQNIENAKAAFSLTHARCAVITSDFHLARARRLMDRAGLDPVGLPAPTPYLSLRLVSHLREYCSTLGLIVTGRYF